VIIGVNDNTNSHSVSSIEESPVPAALSAFLQSESYEDAIKKAILIGGSTNTLASITGSMAHTYYKHISKSIIRKSLARLNPEMKNLLVAFEEKYFPEQKTPAEFILNMRYICLKFTPTKEMSGCRDKIHRAFALC